MADKTREQAERDVASLLDEQGMMTADGYTDALVRAAAAGISEGIRQAREAVDTARRRLVDHWLGAEADGASLALAAIDALAEEANRG